MSIIKMAPALDCMVETRAVSCQAMQTSTCAADQHESKYE